METAKANHLQLDEYLLHLLSILPERAEQSKDFDMDDLLPWSEEMKSWFSAVRVPETTTFLYRGIIERLRRNKVVLNREGYILSKKVIRRIMRENRVLVKGRNAKILLLQRRN